MKKKTQQEKRTQRLVKGGKNTLGKLEERTRGGRRKKAVGVAEERERERERRKKETRRMVSSPASSSFSKFHIPVKQQDRCESCNTRTANMNKERAAKDKTKAIHTSHLNDREEKMRSATAMHSLQCLGAGVLTRREPQTQTSFSTCLAGSIPNLKLDGLALQLNGTDLKIHTNGGAEKREQEKPLPGKNKRMKSESEQERMLQRRGDVTRLRQGSLAAAKPTCSSQCRCRRQNAATGNSCQHRCRRLAAV